MRDLSKIDFSTLPVPKYTGEADRLIGMKFPHWSLESTDGEISLSSLNKRILLFVFPMIGHPDIPLPDGWNDFPGARGCTPQALSYRDNAKSLLSNGIDQILGLSNQSIADLKNRKELLNLSFPLISDESFVSNLILGLPTFELNGTRYFQRLTMIIDHGEICYVRHPVFPPNEDVSHALKWLKS